REFAADPLHDMRSLLRGVKRSIGAERILAADSQGTGGWIDPLDALHMLGRTITERAQGHDVVRARIRRLMVTFPPTWDYRQVERWKELFRRLGYAEDELDLSLDEASAAGLFYVHRWTKDEDERNRLLQDLLRSSEELREGGARVGERYTLHLLSFDFGGGTIDLASIRVDITVLDEVIRMRLRLTGSDSIAWGGDQVTLAVFRILKRRIAMALVDPERLMRPEGPGEREEPI